MMKKECFGIVSFMIPTDNYYLAPTQSKLQKWLRDIHKIHIIIVPTIHGYWTYKIVDIQIDPSKKIVRPPHSIDASGVDYNTYEEALESAFFGSFKDMDIKWIYLLKF